MKLITLNTWGGRAGSEKLLSFFDFHKNVDIFCLQEIWSDAYEFLEGRKAGGEDLKNSDVLVHGKQRISECLPMHSAYFRPHFMDHYGLMILVRSSLRVVEEGEVYVHKEKGFIPEGDIGLHARSIQYVTYETIDGLRTVINFHGLWNGQGKEDSPERIEQSENIALFLASLKNPYVLCGDFNLLPDTRSMGILEDLGLRNLIKDFHITSTRTSLYTKELKFADYILLSNGIKLNEFRVLPEEVSDHSALYLDFQ